jgi:hypothetical protein
MIALMHLWLRIDEFFALITLEPNESINSNSDKSRAYKVDQKQAIAQAFCNSFETMLSTVIFFTTSSGRESVYTMRTEGKE